MLNCGKASGPDGVVAEMLKAGGVEVIQFLIKLSNYIDDNEIYSDEWSKEIVVLMYKKVNPDQADHYR